MVRVYLIRYACHATGELIWWPESLSAKDAFRMGRQMAKQGRRPTIHRVSVYALDVVKAGQSRQVRLVA